MQPIQTLGFTQVHRSLTGLCDGDMHAKRVLSLANATLGVIRTASLPVNTIGQGLTLARGLVTQDAIKPVDRLLSNEDIDVDAARGLGRRVRFRELRLICGLIPLKASPWHVPRSSHGRRQASPAAAPRPRQLVRKRHPIRHIRLIRSPRFGQEFGHFGR